MTMTWNICTGTPVRRAAFTIMTMTTVITTIMTITITMTTDMITTMTMTMTTDMGIITTPG